MSVLLGTSRDDALASLPEGSGHRLGDLPMKLADSRRPVRAAALAQSVQEIVFAIEESALR